MAFIPAVLAVAGTAVTAFGQVEQGQATANAANYQAQVAQNNAQIAEQNAAGAVMAGQQQAAASSLKSAGTAGQIKTAQAASGIDVNTGSAVDVQQSQREQGQLDAETVLHNAQLEAYGYRSQATGFQAQAGLETATAEQAPIGAGIGAAGTILQGASGIASKWTGGASSGGDSGSVAVP